MNRNEVKIDPLDLTFSVNEENWKIEIPKSQTQIKYIDQLKLITKSSNCFVPLSVEEKEDAYFFSFTVKKELKRFADLKKENRNEKLRALMNISTIYSLLSSRVTFLLHPNNLVFDNNLMPLLIYRGIRNQLQPYEMTEEDVLKQLKCLTIALFSKKYTFDELYNGSLERAKDTKFEQEVNEKDTVVGMLDFLEQSYFEEQRRMENTMQLVPKRRFRLFKHMAIWMTVLSVLLVSLLVYTTFIRMPYQERILEAHNEYLANNYSEVIHTLQNENMEKLPYQAKYILANSYINVEQLSDKEKESIMKNISLKSDQYYLLYWIYNGLGDFEKSIDIAKYIDDPTLIIYGLIKKTEQVKNDPELTGTERDEEVSNLRNELEQYTDEYELFEDEGLEDEAEENSDEEEPVNQEHETEAGTEEKKDEKEKDKEDKKEKDKKEKD